MPPDLDILLRAAPGMRWRSDSDGGVLLNTSTGEVFRLNTSGMRIWQLLMAGHSPRAVSAVILRETGAEGSGVEAMVKEFVAAMLEERLLCPAEMGDAAGSGKE